MKRLACCLLALFLMAVPALAQTGPLDKDERQAVVTRAGELLADQYIYPDRALAAQARINQALAAGAYDGITDPAAFAQSVTDDLRAVLHDKHVRVAYEGPQGQPAASQASASAPPSTEGGFVRVDRLKGNIGYIKLLSFPFPGIFEPAAEAAMRDVAGTDALIIDMRDNGGGSAESDSYFGSFFFDPKKPVQLNSIVNRKAGTNEFAVTEFWTKPAPSPYLKPVYILTSARTFSGGEAFVYDLQAQKRARIYGETTGGGANPGGGRHLNARFGMFIPNGRAENPITKTNWEGTGVVPDMPMDAKLAFQAAMRDIIAKRGGTAAMKNQVTAEVDPQVEAHLLTIRTTPLPGSEAALRRNIEELALGTPNYDRMSKPLADATREQLPKLGPAMKSLGAIQSVTFHSVGPDGMDIFDVTMANGAMQSGIFVSADGRIQSAWVRMRAPQAPAAGP
jgi:hypothetical protein